MRVTVVAVVDMSDDYDCDRDGLNGYEAALRVVASERVVFAVASEGVSEEAAVLAGVDLSDKVSEGVPFGVRLVRAVAWLVAAVVAASVTWGCTVGAAGVVFPWLGEQPSPVKLPVGFIAILLVAVMLLAGTAVLAWGSTYGLCLVVATHEADIMRDNAVTKWREIRYPKSTADNERKHNGT